MFGPVPVPTHPFVNSDGKPTKEFYNFLKRLSEDSIALAAQVTTIQTFVNGMTTPILVSALPSPSPAGQRRICSDVGPPLTFGSTVGPGGSTNTVPVYSDGTNWRLG